MDETVCSLTSIYILYAVFFPISALWGIKIRCNKVSDTLLSTNDTLYLRGVSACFVILAHFCIWTNKLTSVMNRLFYLITSQLGGIGVLIFFFVSGYGIYESYANKPPSISYLYKRGRNAYLPYFMVKICFLFINFVIGTRSEIKLKDIILIATVEDWFIRVILIQYIAFYVIWRFFSKRKIIEYSVIVDFVMSFIFIMQHKPDGWFNALWLFTFGMVCSQYKNKIISFFEKHIHIKVMLLCSASAVFGGLFVYNKGVYWADVFKPVSGVFLCIAICGVMYCREFTSRIMAYFGRRSMYLYIVHINIWNLIDILGVVEKFWIALVISILFTEILYQFIEIFFKQKICSFVCF